jgi:hypothetical protein
MPVAAAPRAVVHVLLRTDAPKGAHGTRRIRCQLPTMKIEKWGLLCKVKLFY